MIRLAKMTDKQMLENIDGHIPSARLDECIRCGQIYVLTDDSSGAECMIGLLRYSLFWQTIPFVDLLYIEGAYRSCGFGTRMMCEWENEMKARGYKYVMTSTQADEDAWRFYEKLGYSRAGGFFPPEQEAEEIIYLKTIVK